MVPFERLGDNAYVGDAGPLYRVHYRGEGPEGNIFIGADEDALAPGIADFGVQPLGNFVDVHRIVSEIDSLVFGTLTSMPDCRMGAVTINITSSTSTTSTKGVTLISESELWVRPLLFVKATAVSYRASPLRSMMLSNSRL